MHKILRNLLVGLFAITVASANASAADPENTLVIELKDGNVVIEMLPDLAPTHVARIKELAREGFYDGIVFHRVIPGFMAQTGDPTGTGGGGSGNKLNAEFSREPFVRGIVGMARSPAGFDTADSQFFIMFENNYSLNRKYTVWGKVIQGMEFVDAIKMGPPGSGKVNNPDSMISVKVLADVQ